MIMASYGGWEFDDNDGLDVTSNHDDLLDFESLFNTLDHPSCGDYLENGLADPSNAASCSESGSHGAGNGSLPFPLLYDSEASASRAFCLSGSDVNERQAFNSDFKNLETYQNAFPMQSVGDWMMPVSTTVNPWLANHEATQEFSLASNNGNGETNFESANNNNTFVFTNDSNTNGKGNHYLLDKTGLTNEISDNSIINGHQTFEIPEFLEAPEMDLSGYSDIPYAPNHGFSMPYFTSINEPLYFGLSRQIQSSNHDDGKLFDAKIESQKRIVQNLPRNDVMRYETIAGRSDGTAPVDQDFDIGRYVSAEASNTCSASGGSSLGQANRVCRGIYKCDNNKLLIRLKDRQSAAPTPTLGTTCTEQSFAEGSNTGSSGGNSLGQQTSEDHGTHECNTPKKSLVIRIKTMNSDAATPTLGTTRRKQSISGGKSRVTAKRSTPIYVQNHAKLNIDDEQSGHQVSSQEITPQKSEIPLVDGGLAVPLLRHQRIALSWMSKKETKSIHCCGGILADDQGLGKTISAIALILKERSPSRSGVSAIETREKETETLCLDADGDEDTLVQSKCSLAGGTLVVCPTSVLRQWNDELQSKVVSEANLSVLVYYGGNRTKDPYELAKYDVVITTYAIVSMEVPKQPLDEGDDETKLKISPFKKRKYPPASDESCEKYKKGIDHETLECIDRPLAKLRWFRVILDEAQSIKNYKTQAAKACWGLRAKRRWCLSGTPIQNSVDDLYSYFRFLKYDPFSVFKKFCSQIKAPIQRNPVAGYKRLQVILKTIMLRRTKGTLLKGEPIIILPPKTITLKMVDFTAEERGFYQSLEAESRAQFAEYAAAGTVKQNYINILLLLLRLRQACDHPLLVKGCSTTTNWRLSVEKAKGLPQEKVHRLLNCLEASLAICSICNDPPEDAVVTTCEHVFCNQCILEHLSSDDSHCPSAKCKSILSRSSVFCKSTLSVSVSDQPCSEEAEVVEPCSSNGPIDQLKIEATKALESSKIKAAIEVLKSISKPQEITLNDTDFMRNSVVKEKAIVFSQWTGMLDLVEVCLKDSSIGYRRLDGTMSVVARDKAVKDFNTLPEVTVMIMSLKAASLGLNMVAACHVILLDLWWNPTTEDQAIDRAHRIGQTRPVTVFRFTVKDTVEDRILALQKKKREMVASAFGEDKNGGSQARLTVDDMKYLFQA
uniref:helicase-like transcription factor CHR28 n=1 Tax=Erigeron canadensis TaxID=72917 RepID=UPI001CB90F6C|nr:helicase-like transcription factor CHR28 [Erigeron canadensis]